MTRALLSVLAGIAVALGVSAPSNAAPVYACAWQMVTVTDVYGNYAYAWQRNCGWVEVADRRAGAVVRGVARRVHCRGAVSEAQGRP